MREFRRRYGARNFVALRAGLLLVPFMASYGLQDGNWVPAISYAATMGILSCFVVLLARRRYPSSGGGITYDTLLVDVLPYRRTFCLLLRPFGQDGQTLIKLHAVGPKSYLEQTVTDAARRALGMRTYALVDSRETLAVPGTIPVRVENERWQSCAKDLIDNARAIVILLSSAEELHGGFAWEVRQLSKRVPAERVVLVIPPHPPRSPQYLRCIMRAARILAALVASDDDRIERSRVQCYEDMLARRVTVLVSIENGPKGLTPRPWCMSEVDHRTNLTAESYENTLVKIFRKTPERRTVPGS